VTLRLLALSGSVRRDSTNTALLRAAAEAAPAGVEVVVYTGLGTLPIFNADHTEALPPAAAALRAALAACDGLLISSPEYIHGVPGGLKNALDWIVGWGEFAGKPVALWRASEYGEYARAALDEILVTMAAAVVPEAGLTLHLRGKKPAEMAPLLATAHTRATLRRSLEAFTRAIVDRRSVA
jgi:NAD(P)H-dependent FMN reductase